MRCTGLFLYHSGHYAADARMCSGRTPKANRRPGTRLSSGNCMSFIKRGAFGRLSLFSNAGPITLFCRMSVGVGLPALEILAVPAPAGVYRS